MRKSVCFFDIVRVFVCLFVRVHHKDGSPEERKVKKEKRGKRGKRREERKEWKEKRGKKREEREERLEEVDSVSVSMDVYL